MAELLRRATIGCRAHDDFTSVVVLGLAQKKYMAGRVARNIVLDVMFWEFGNFLESPAPVA